MDNRMTDLEHAASPADAAAQRVRQQFELALTARHARWAKSVRWSADLPPRIVEDMEREWTRVAISTEVAW